MMSYAYVSNSPTPSEDPRKGTPVKNRMLCLMSLSAVALAYASRASLGAPMEECEKTCTDEFFSSGASLWLPLGVPDANNGFANVFCQTCFPCTGQQDFLYLGSGTWTFTHPVNGPSSGVGTKRETVRAVTPCDGAPGSYILSDENGGATVVQLYCTCPP